MTDHILKFGDLITIQGSIQPNQSVKKNAQSSQEPETSGFLSAIGFTDNRVFLQTVPPNLTSTNDQLKKASTWNNYRDLVFQVWPKVSYEAHKQMKKLKKEKALLNNAAAEDVKAAFEEKMKKLKNRVEEEVEENHRMISHVLGVPVVYGTEIQLMHFSSGSFLSSRVACSDSDKSAYKFELVNEFNSGMSFKLLPRFQIRQEGDPVQLRDQVLLFSMKMKCYVNFANDKRIELDEKIEIPSNLPVITSPYEHRKLTEGTKRFEAHVSQTCDCVWKIHYYGPYVDVNSTTVRGGDLVKLKHTEIDAFLAADIPIHGKNPDAMGQKYSDDYEFKEEYNNINTVWEVEVEDPESRGKNCSVTDDLAKPQAIRLRHLLTGKLLSVENVSGERILVDGQSQKSKTIAVTAKEDPNKQKTPTVVFKSFTSNASGELTYNVAYGLCIADESGSYKYVRALETDDVSAKKDAYNSVQSDGAAIAVYKPLEESESAAKKTVMTCENTEPNPEHAFMIIRVPEEEAKQISFAASSISTLKYFRDITKICKTADVNPNIVTKTLGVLKDLIFFVHKVDDTVEDEVDAVEYEGITVQEKQRLLKDFRVIELLTEILYYPFQRKIVNLDAINNEGFTKIFQHCYRLIKHIIKEYRPNEIYASQWLEYYMDQAMKSNAENDIKAEATLIELIDNNKKILDDKINSEMIEKFVEMLKENKNEKFVKLLRALCVCDNDPVVANQTDMSRFIIEDEPTRNMLIYQKFKKANGKIEILNEAYDSQEWITLPNFKALSEREDDKGEKYSYFLSMIYLLSDLCLGRNYIAMDFLKTVYTYDICFEIITDELSDFELKSAFAKLINTLWIDRKPYQPLNIPQYLILWDEINPQLCSQIAKTDSDDSMFNGLKDYLANYYNKLAKEGCNKIYEVERNSFTSITLEITTKLVKFGFYTDVEQLKGLLKPILVLLNGMKDMMTQHDFEIFKKKLKSVKKPKKHAFVGTSDLEERNTQRYEENERTNIVMDCKNQICELIKIILNIDDDLRLRQFLLEFKNELSNSNRKDNDVSDFSRSPDKKSLFGFKRNDGPIDYAQNALEWIQNISERNPINLNKLAPTSFVKMLFDLCLYDHEDLVNNSFELLNITHSQRNRLVEMLQSVHILEDTEKKRSVLAIEGDIKALWEMAETTETWYEKKDDKSVDISKRCISLVKKLAGYLVNDSLLGKGMNPEPDAEIVTNNRQQREDAFDDEEEDLFNEDQEVDPEFQTILRNLKIHEPLLEILSYESKRYADKTNELRIAVICEVAKLLTKFAANCKANQALLIDHMGVFQTILTRYVGSGVGELIEVLFKNNRALVRQIDEVQKFSKSFIRIISKLKINNSRSARMLLSLEPFMRYKDNVIKENQTAILSLLTLKENIPIFVTLDPKKTSREDLLREDIFKKLDAFNAALQNPSGFVELSPELDYLSSLFEIMACACDGKNAITESKSQNAWPLMHLGLLYERAQECWYLKRTILMFVYHVYLDTERAMREGSDLHKLMFTEVIKDMEFLTENFTSRYEIKYHKGSMDNKQSQELYYFQGLLPCIDDIMNKRLFAEVNDFQDKLAKMLECLLKMKQLPFNRALRQKLKATIEKFRINAHSIYVAAIENNKVDLMEMADLSRDMSKRMSISGLAAAAREEDTKNLKLKVRLTMLGQKEEFQECIEDEFESMISILINIEKEADGNIYSSLVPFADVVQSIIKLVTKHGQEKDLVLIGLKALRKIIERENKEEALPAAEWDGDTWMKYEKKIIDRQNQLSALGVVDMVCEIMSNTTDAEIQKECILVGIALLLGGNAKVQKAFCESIQSDISNEFLFEIRAMIDKNFNLVKKEMSLRNKYYLNKLYEKEEALLNKQQLLAAKTPLTTSPKLDHRGSDLGSSKDFDENLLDDDEDGQLGTAMPDSEEAKQSLEILQLTYRFLQLFCEGHNLQMQDQLREQTDSKGNVKGKSQDFISRTAYYFNTLIKQINVDSLDFGVQMLDFLIEAMQGPCHKNQQALVKAKIINSCMDFLMTFKQDRDYQKQGFIEPSQYARVNDATTTATKLLNTLIEGSNDPEIIEEMGTLDFQFLIFKLSQEYQTFVKEQLQLNPMTVKPADVKDALKSDSFNQQILESFDVYILMANLADSNPKVASFLKNTEEYNDLERNALEFFRNNLANIEIMFQDKLLKIYFPVYPICRYLSKDSRKNLMVTVNRDSPNEKIMGLVGAAEDLFDEMGHMAYLKEKLVVFSQTNYNILRDLSTMLSLAINIIILVASYYNVESGATIKYPRAEANAGNSESENQIQQSMNVLGYIQIVTSSLMIVFWFFINAPVILSRKWREYVSQNKPQDGGEDVLAFLDEEANIDELPLDIVLTLLARKGKYDPLFNPNGKRKYGHFFVRLVCYWQDFIFIMTEGKFIFMLFYFIISVLGIAVSEITYCFHLLDVINRFDTLKNVIKSVTTNLNQLLLTGLLGLILIYIYALFGFYFIDEMFYNGDAGDSGERSCTSMFHCYMTTLNYGLRNGGGIGESLTFISYQSGSRIQYYFRLVYDLSFFIIINVVFLNIIFGIIIDTFAELRDKKNMIDTDMTTTCFICSIDRYTFDKNGTGFESHIDKHHHLWNYVFYIYSVNSKDPTEYNGIESYVQEKLQAEDSSWFPLHKAIELGDGHEE